MTSRAVARGLIGLLVVFEAAYAPPALSVSKGEVEEACAASQDQYREYEAAYDAFVEASLAYEAVLQEQEALRAKRERIATITAQRQSEIADTESAIQRLAVELYMQGGVGQPGLMLLAQSPDQLLTGSEFLSAATGDAVQTLDDLMALRADLERFQRELADLDAELERLEAERLQVMQVQQETAQAERAAWEKLSGRCRTLRARYEAQVAAERARRAARSGGGAAGVGPISGFRCPFPGSSFIDSWGFPRSGGRTHKGTDMMGPYGAPVVAASSGTVWVGNGGLGGLTIWLIADNGFAYYYAHLADWAVSSGQRVSAGEVIAYNGNSGNAAGGAPHVHFQIHPGGRSASPVNPYPTLVAACR